MSAIGTPAWEQSKENAAPLQRGRNVTAQENAKSISPQETEQKIQQYEQLVRPSEPPNVTAVDGDPLSHWLEYIKYYQSAFPTDTREQFLLMERCTRALVKMKQYSDDDRFIGVCAKYADKTKDPGQVFKYLHQQKIGTASALFWVAWAFVAEKDEDFQFAEQIFKKGLSKNAQPLQMLKIRHQQFQRRMSRHWLNASATNDQLDDGDDEEEVGSRQRQRALGGISRDRLRSNDRARTTRTRPHERSQFSRGIGQQNTSSQNGQKGSFAIFVEGDEENIENRYNLDDSGVDKNRIIAAEADRRKENNMAAERWNDRGGLTNPLSRKQPPARPKAPPTAFPVFVDEECAAQHQQESQEKQSHAEKHRHVRDERTFRERTEEESHAARLARDPLRYVLDPSQRDKDLAEEAKAKSKVDPSSQQGTKRDRKCKIGFDKRMLKDQYGEEQSFEEARANAHAYATFPSSNNFNLLKQLKHDTSSQMDCDEGGSFDTAMTDSENTNGSIASYRQQQKPLRKEGRVLFRNEASFEGSLNQTAISTASSTIHPTDAAGIPGKRDEETINTKFAMKELSMMFSSPAFGVDEVSRKTGERQAARLDRSMIGGQQVVDTSFDAIGDMIGNTDLDNSIINPGSTNINDENRGGPHNPSARAIGAPDIDQTALQEIDSEEQDAPSLSCGAQSRAVVGAVARSSPQDDPFRGKEVPLLGNPGFQIFEDEDIDDDSATHPKDDLGNESISKEQRSDNSDGSDESQNRDTAMYDHSTHSAHHEDGTSEAGDTVTSTLFNEVFGKIEQRGNSQGIQSETSPILDGNRTDGEETATSSLFNEVIGGLKPKTKNQEKGGSGFSIFIDEEENLDVQEEEEVQNPRKLEKMGKAEEVNDTERAVDYNTTHERDVRIALQQVNANARVASDSKAPLSSLLSQRKESYHLPHVPLPPQFRKKFVKVKTAIKLGKHEGMVMKELGRGAYGVVVLMEGGDEGANDKIAVKVQSPTDCLAWERQILLRVEHRVSAKCSGAYPFPRALSFVSLADGGMLGMTTGSKSGLNLIDLVNIYASRTQNVPELVALHYTSKMLRIIEILHWHGKTLHCDVKPDNFVLSDISYSGSDDIKYSDLVLVDFGRAIDLAGLSNEYDDVRKAKLVGNAAQGDMKCIAMRNGDPWSYDIDTYGILSSAHMLLFGSHMELKKEAEKGWKPPQSKKMKRYWKTELWDELFTKILNNEIGSHVTSLRSIREKIDLHLKEKESTLHSLLVKQEHMIPSSRKN